MKNIRLLKFSIAILAIVIISCNNEKPSVEKVSEKTILPDGGYVLTDSLIYGIFTHSMENIDSSEIAGFRTFLQRKFIDYIFNQIYAGKLKAYNFFTDKELSIKEVKSIEKSEGFNRSNVGKVQFNETWVIDKQGILTKRVNSMTLGTEHYSNQGTFVGYNALFTIKFKVPAQ
jgi:hypothetical protein